MTDILISPLLHPHRHPPIQPSASSSTESNDSKKIWEALKRKFSGRLGRENEGLEGLLFAPTFADDFEYNMNHKNRGKVIIFNHVEFDPSQGLQPRPGTQKDAIDLTNSFQRLDFQVECYNDLTFDKLYGILEKEALSNHRDDDCIVIIVLTHGKHHFLHAYDVMYKPESLWKMFTADKSVTLAGKPKIFLIQACRGDEYDEGTTLLSPKSRTVVDGPGDKKSYKIPNQADFLMVFSTAPACEQLTINDNRTFVTRLFQYLSLSNSGHFSWRNTSKGGCFVQAFCKVMDKFAWDMDLLSLTTIVNKEVAINYESKVPSDVTQDQKKQIPHVSHTLTRQIRFYPKSINSSLV